MDIHHGRRRFSAVLAGFLALILQLSVGVTTAQTAMTSFNAGSYIIASDACWQPNNDPATTQDLPAYCDGNRNDSSLYQLYHLLYTLLATGDMPGACANVDKRVPLQKELFGYCKQLRIHWLINATKNSPQGLDLLLTTAGATGITPLVTICNSTKNGSIPPFDSYVTRSDSGTATTIGYRGGPFVIDANDITPTEMAAVVARFPAVKIHRATIPFSGNVTRVLTGNPPKIAVLSEGTSEPFENFLRVAAAESWRDKNVFQYITTRDVLAGCLADPLPATCRSRRPDLVTPFGLLWSSHWDIGDRGSDGSTPTAEEQQAVLTEIRNFLGRGNPALFGCAGIGSMEGGSQFGTNFTIGGGAIPAGGVLLPPGTGGVAALPRVESNAGCSDRGGCGSGYLAAERPSAWLSQCGGWEFAPGSGTIRSMRPAPPTGNPYTSTTLADDPVTTVDDRFIGFGVSRLLHDARAQSGDNSPLAAGDTYHLSDYLVGGQSDGSPTTGYLSYLPGHSFITCLNETTSGVPPVRTVDFTFAAPPVLLTIEAVHGGCTGGITCPRVTFKRQPELSGAGYATIGSTSSMGGTVRLSAEFAHFDMATNRVAGVTVEQSDPTGTAAIPITDFIVTGGTLSAITDITAGSPPRTICKADMTGGAGSAVHCPPVDYSVGPYQTGCAIDWSHSNSCGSKYALNTLAAPHLSLGSAEISKTQPIIKDNILYQAGFDYPGNRGHLRMIRVPLLQTDGSYTASTIQWDSANAMPVAGTGGFPVAPLSSTDTTSPRHIFTNLPGATNHLVFDPSSFKALAASERDALRNQLGAATTEAAAVIINTVRGRTAASLTSPCGVTGCGEEGKRLWAIETSTPALKTRSKLIESSNGDTPPVVGRDRRDRVLFAGGTDGMLHAFHGGTYDSVRDQYPDNDSGWGSGRELWAYIPGTLLSRLKEQPFTTHAANQAAFRPQVTLNGSPLLTIQSVRSAAGQTLSADLWKQRVRLVGTGADVAATVGTVFALDVTDQYSPRLLWENSYHDSGDASGCGGSHRNCNMGESAGVASGAVLVGKIVRNYVFLTSNWTTMRSAVTGALCTDVMAATAEYRCGYGISAFALDSDTGDVMWQSSYFYRGSAAGINAVPATPALMSRDNNGVYDYVVFGDMQGRLWILNSRDGSSPYGTELPGTGTPNPAGPSAYQVKRLDSNGLDAIPAVFTFGDEPIGASVAIYRNYIILGTGGTDFASNARDYRVEVLRFDPRTLRVTKDDSKTIVTGGFSAGGAIVHGEKIWAQPTVTSDQKVVIATAVSYFTVQPLSVPASIGRVLILDLTVGRTGSYPYKNVQMVGAPPTSGGTAPATTNPATIFSGGFFGGIGIDHRRLYGITGTGNAIQAGPGGTTSGTGNPFQIIWWRKL